MIKHAIIGTGGMANSHAREMAQIEGVQLVACCDLFEDRVKAFADVHGIAECYTDVAEMLAKCPIDSVSIVTPDGTHAALTLQAIEAGKHVLCEKPLATNVADAEAMAQAAQKAGVINMVNFTYRKSSALQRAAEWIQNGELGRIYHVEANYFQSWLNAKYWGDWKTESKWLWRLSTEHGSNGVLGDIGIHVLDFATYPVGGVANLYCQLKNFDKAPENRIGDYNLDANDTALITLEFKNGAVGMVTTTRYATGHRNSLSMRIYGELGTVRIDLDRAYDVLEFCRIDANGNTEPWQTLYCPPTPTVYESFIESIKTGVQQQPDFERGLEIQKLLSASVESSKVDHKITF
ncbi:Gfo/Idh/MocA family protein [Coraliomargarita parva]|uniref:Gfo/Idh/MocA family protein n=1 Tax=Coraliomargarita parva TaxID=3014050 RepID=UPI0022B4AB5A|nr:Gfo/Idh/MocA family oxidoreductase [Coraliomargarita parva]